jgi:hypothetical protein
MGGACSTCVGRRGVYRVSVGKTEGNGPLERPRARCDDNINMDIQIVGWDRMDWIVLVQCRNRWRALVNAVIRFQVP